MSEIKPRYFVMEFEVQGDLEGRDGRIEILNIKEFDTKTHAKDFASNYSFNRKLLVLDEYGLNQFEGKL